MDLEHLPPDCLNEILSYLPIYDVIRMSLVSRQLRFKVIAADFIWKRLALKRWREWNDPIEDLKKKLRPNSEGKEKGNEEGEELTDWHRVFKYRIEIDQRVKALLILVGDTWNNRIQNLKEIWKFERDAIDRLKQVQKETTNDMTLLYHCTLCLNQIWRDIAKKEWQEILSKPEEEWQMEDCSILVSKVANPEIQRSEVKRKLDALAEGVRERVEQAPSNREKINVLLDYLFKEKGFQGNFLDYYETSNSFLDKVLETKKGIPISLSILFSCVALRLEIQVIFTNFPMHFLSKVYDPEAQEYLIVDSFAQGGKILNIDECKKLLGNQGFRPQLLNPVPKREVVLRQYRNLLKIYSQLHQIVPLRNVLDHSLALNPQDMHYRLLRSRVISLESHDEIQIAIEDLEYFLHNMTPYEMEAQFALNEDQIRTSLAAAKKLAEFSPFPSDSSSQKQKNMIGKTIVHKKYEYQGVVFGWQYFPGLTLPELDYQEVENLIFQNQPFYLVLIHQGGYRHVAEENIAAVKIQRIENRNLGRYFTRFTEERGYIRNNLSYLQYPDV